MTSVALPVGRRLGLRPRFAAPLRGRARSDRRSRILARPSQGFAPSWEIRSFAAASAAILIAFVLALAYLAGSTGVASEGYEAQRLQTQRDELRRQNALLELEVAKLSAPARIENEARRLGLVRLSFVRVVDAVPLAARR